MICSVLTYSPHPSLCNISTSARLAGYPYIWLPYVCKALLLFLLDQMVGSSCFTCCRITKLFQNFPTDLLSSFSKWSTTQQIFMSCMTFHQCQYGKSCWKYSAHVNTVKLGSDRFYSDSPIDLETCFTMMLSSPKRTFTICHKSRLDWFVEIGPGLQIRDSPQTLGMSLHGVNRPMKSPGVMIDPLINC